MVTAVLFVESTVLVALALHFPGHSLQMDSILALDG